jgi:hypothetical protein
MKELKEMSGSGWDAERMEVLLDDDVWESLRAAVSNSRLECLLPILIWLSLACYPNRANPIDMHCAERADCSILTGRQCIKAGHRMVMRL